MASWVAGGDGAGLEGAGASASGFHARGWRGHGDAGVDALTIILRCSRDVQYIVLSQGVYNDTRCLVFGGWKLF